MGTKELRAKHNTIPEWVFHDPKDRPAFTKGTIRLDKADLDLAMEMFYAEMGWDKASGAPTQAAYEKAGLKEVGAKLAEKKLV
jgi:aldehyde:ferredoxin oxidoreductase